jgi:hypothetical protein
MAHFDFSLNDFTNGKNISNAIIGGTKSYTPTGEAKWLRTTYSMVDAKAQQSLTTTNVSDMLQGTTVYKPMGLIYNSFNDVLSRDIQLARNVKVGDRLLSMDKAHTGLLPYDSNKRDASIDIASSVNALTTSAGSTGTPAAADNGTTTSAGGQGSGPGTEIFVPPAGKSWPKGTLSIDDVAKLVIEVGISENAQAVLVAISHRESSFRTGAYNPVGLDNSWGLWQINTIDGASPQYRRYDLTDPYTNARVMAIMSGSGANLHPWYTQHDGSNEPDYSSAYSVQDFLPEAIVAVQRVKAQGYRAG